MAQRHEQQDEKCRVGCVTFGSLRDGEGMKEGRGQSCGDMCVWKVMGESVADLERGLWLGVGSHGEREGVRGEGERGRRGEKG